MLVTYHGLSCLFRYCLLRTLLNHTLWRTVKDVLLQAFDNAIEYHRENSTMVKKKGRWRPIQPSDIYIHTRSFERKWSMVRRLKNVQRERGLLQYQYKSYCGGTTWGLREDPCLIEGLPMLFPKLPKPLTRSNFLC